MSGHCHVGEYAGHGDLGQGVSSNSNSLHRDLDGRWESSWGQAFHSTSEPSKAKWLWLWLWLWLCVCTLQVLERDQAINQQQPTALGMALRDQLEAVLEAKRLVRSQRGKRAGGKGAGLWGSGSEVGEAWGEGRGRGCNNRGQEVEGISA